MSTSSVALVWVCYTTSCLPCTPWCCSSGSRPASQARVLCKLVGKVSDMNCVRGNISGSVVLDATYLVHHGVAVVDQDQQARLACNLLIMGELCNISCFHRKLFIALQTRSLWSAGTADVGNQDHVLFAQPGRRHSRGCRFHRMFNMLTGVHNVIWVQIKHSRRA